MIHNARFVSLLCCILAPGCATAPPVGEAKKQAATVATKPAKEAADAEWKAGPGAEAALAALWKVKPFELSAAELAKASGGPAPSWAKTETLLEEVSVEYDEAGRMVERSSRRVYRILHADPDYESLSVSWPAWREVRPVLRARVVSAEGEESWLDEKTIVEATDAGDAIHLTDAKELKAALPGARVGAVVEIRVIRHETQPAFVAGTSQIWTVWQREPLRRTRLKVRYPNSLPLKVRVIGIEPLHESHSAAKRELTLDIEPPEFNPFRLADLDVAEKWPRVELSTGQSWHGIASAYLEWVREARKADFDAADLVQASSQLSQRRQKVQAALNWMRGKVRYTALHLGDGALKPTSPSSVLARGYGDCKDLSVLLVAALGKIGVTAAPALIKSEGMQPQADLPGIGGFDHMIVFVPGDKTEPALWVDTTAEDYPVGILPLALLERPALIIDATTTALTSTPSRRSVTSRINETWTIELADFGDAKGRFELEGNGSADGHLRSAWRDADGEKLKEFARNIAASLFKKSTLKVEVTNRKPGEGSSKFVATTDDAGNADTGESYAVVSLQNVPMPTWTSDDLLGKDPATLPTDADGKKTREEKIMEETKLTSAEFERRPVKLGSQQQLVRTFIIKPPRGFVPSTLPKNRTLPMGPALWNETFTVRPDGSVEARFQFSTEVVEFGPEDLVAFRKAYWEMMHETAFKLGFDFAPRKKFDDGKPAEAMALFHKLLDASPHDGVLRARYAKTLLDYGLGKQAQREIQQAAHDTPNHAFVLIVQGAVARCDADGRLFTLPFDREEAVKRLRQALAIVPNHSWVRLALAETLERDSQGETQWKSGPDLDEAAQLYEKLVEEGNSSQAHGKLLDILLRTKRYEEILAFKSRHGENTADTYGRIAEIIIKGSDAMVEEVRNSSHSEKETVNIAITTLGTLAAIREYKHVDTLVDALVPVLPGGAGVVAKNAFFGLKATPLIKDFSSPEAAAKSALSLLANALTTHERAQGLAALASAHGRHELTGKTGSLDLLGWWIGGAAQFGADALVSKGHCVADGKETVGFRVRCNVDFAKPITATFWWVREKGQFRLESLGHMQTLADNAWIAAKAGRVEGATMWLNWWADRLEQVAADSRREALFKGTWPPRDGITLEAAKFAAAEALTLTDFVEAPADAVEAFETGVRKLTGQNRRLATQMIASVLAARRDFNKAVEILKPLADSEGEDRLLQQLVYLLYHAKRYSEARQIVDAGLKRMPNDSDWLQSLAFVNASEGKYRDTINIFEKIVDKTDEILALSNLVWYRFMAGIIDDDTEKKGLRLVSGEHPSLSQMHNAAVVLLARGKIPQGAEIANRRLNNLGDGKWDDPQWHMRAQVLAALGFNDEAREAWSHVTDKDIDFVRLKASALKELGSH